VAHTATAIVQHRAPATHDGFQYFTLQYFFLNNAAQGGGVAQWIPYMSHGTVATLWYGIQGSLLQQVLLRLPPLVRQSDLLTLFHLSAFVDSMMLLAGTWLLARRFFQLPAVVFIVVSIVGSAVWLDQPYWNFRLYYALPLVLDLGHRFLDTGRWRWFFLSANLLAIQVIGNLPYFIPVASFTVFVYFAGFAALHRAAMRERLRSLRLDRAAAAAIAGSVASFVAVYASMVIGTADLITYSAGRSADGSTTLIGFLTYGGATGIQQWLDVVLNVSPSLDMTLYAGILLLPLTLVGLVTVDRRRFHFVVAATVMLLFTLGTVVSVAAFRVWPGMRFFRHIALVSPLVKVLIVFVAGIGLERLLDFAPPRRTLVRVSAIAAAIVLLAGAGVALNLARSPSPQLHYMDPDPAIDRPDHMYDRQLVAARLYTSSALAIAGAVVLAAAAFTPRRGRAAAIAVALSFAAADVYYFKFTHLFTRSDVVPPPARIALRPAPMNYPPRRELNVRAALAKSGRLRATMTFNRVLRNSLQGRAARGTQYWTSHAFFFTDEAGSSFRMDSWLRPLDQLMRMYWDAPIDNESALPPGIDLGQLTFPMTRPGAGAVAGVLADKIRLFSTAYAVATPADLVPVMTSQSYAGNMLFILSDAAAPPDSAQKWTRQQPLSGDDSRPLSYEVVRFDANTLAIRVANPDASAGWLSYADVWHPSWATTVNGKRVPVYRANMAYKAVPLEGGENLIEFRFGSRLFSTLAALASLNAAAWLLGLVLFVTRSSR
jgi:hypothetical protein